MLRHLLSCPRTVRVKQTNLFCLISSNGGIRNIAKVRACPYITESTKTFRRHKPMAYFDRPPNCLRCGTLSVRHITSTANTLGNVGRPYYNCPTCRGINFVSFDDHRGVHADNPLCLCGQASRIQVAGPESRIPHGVHFVCASAECTFFAWCWTESEENIWSLDRNQIQQCVGDGIL
jgi:hypothetical protein